MPSGAVLSLSVAGLLVSVEPRDLGCVVISRWRAYNAHSPVAGQMRLAHCTGRRTHLSSRGRPISVSRYTPDSPTRAVFRRPLDALAGLMRSEGCCGQGERGQKNSLTATSRPAHHLLASEEARAPSTPPSPRIPEGCDRKLATRSYLGAWETPM
ncbi:hypothetical protein F4780DRAFT_387614 [Xylariomycetidae sp. FL0641]|nr:hypothetical protein F4780DRAFT_387614 [Xylariomycetidae sp. FL0641]